VQKGNEFEYQGTIFRVSKVYPDQQQALCESFPVGSICVLPLDVLKPLILARHCETSSDEEIAKNITSFLSYPIVLKYFA
jgi:hypothetical protein